MSSYKNSLNEEQRRKYKMRQRNQHIQTAFIVLVITALVAFFLF